MRFVTLVGNPKAESRTAVVAEAATQAVINASGVRARQETIDLSALACRLLLPQPSALIEDAVEEVLAADVLVVASPTFKATYTGLLKVFLDRLGFRALATTLALPVLVMKHPEHALAVEVHMRPLLVELGATVPTPGLAVMESDLAKLDHVLIPWARRMAGPVGAKAAALIQAPVPAQPARASAPTQNGHPPQNGHPAQNDSAQNGQSPHNGHPAQNGSSQNGHAAQNGSGQNGSGQNGHVARVAQVARAGKAFRP